MGADGSEAVFVSRAPLTGYDNTDVASGHPDFEVYIYEADAGGGTGALRCVSCNPSGARPEGKDLEKAGLAESEFWSAAEIPPFSTSQYAPRVLSADGSRLFFESYDGLLPEDTNGVKDVYEWERASGQADCEELGATLYVASAGGCLSLISTGHSPQESEFIDASEDGRDVFFTTAQSLVAEDPGLVDLYDAREGGGFAPKATATPCEGESCQPAAAAPGAPGAASGPNGSTNLTPLKCRKGTHRVTKGSKTTCVKNAKKKSSHKKRHAKKTSHKKGKGHAKKKHAGKGRGAGR